MGHISVYTGVFDIEKSDRVAKEGANPDTIEVQSLLPKSHIKSVFKSKILPKWKNYWDSSKDGSHTYNLIPKSLTIYII